MTRASHDAPVGIGETSRADSELLALHEEGRAAIEAGDYLDAGQLADAMRDAGRLPR